MIPEQRSHSLTVEPRGAKMVQDFGGIFAENVISVIAFQEEHSLAAALTAPSDPLSKRSLARPAGRSLIEMSKEEPYWIDSPWVVKEPGNWHLKEGAPEDLKKDFAEWMRSDEPR